ncbi:MAG: hypothetical protein AAGJ31_10795, partial [Verrucomicrobiota bacterium]
AEHSDEALMNALIERGEGENSLDTGLKRQALNAGVRLHFNQSIRETDADLVATGPRGKKRRGLAISENFEIPTQETLAYVRIDQETGSHGYSYLLAAAGKACLSSVAWSHFDRAKSQFEISKKDLLALSGVRVTQSRLGGGIATYSTNPRFHEFGRFFAGEASGLQDPLWGFGVRSSILSGHYAALGILNEIDYESASRAHFQPRVQAGIVNRFLWERIGRMGSQRLLTAAERSPDLKRFLRALYAGSFSKKLLFPLASLLLKPSKR